MRVYERAGKFDLTDDDGHLIEAGFETEEAALAKADIWQKAKEWRDRLPNSYSTVGAIPVERTPPSGTLNAPAGRSWFVTRIKAPGWELEEHRVPAELLGTEALLGTDQVRHHQCSSEGELTRLRRSLADQGLFDRGIEA